MNNKKIITVAEFSKKYGFGLRYSYQLANAEGFPMIKTGRKINILADKVDAWLENNIGKQF
ncbi:DNA-binding protein [Clostridium sp. 1001270J_160509_D11]|uniref:DNA-binding protein n=1 Tax=Clostridium sp. 1001270J_160509_D11 TaxID=2787103 RepID=UPI0018A94BC8|nr:DNA-binding protein [Clostridium sp. 1001270J_160509_D11]